MTKYDEKLKQKTICFNTFFSITLIPYVFYCMVYVLCNHHHVYTEYFIIVYYKLLAVKRLVVI